MGPTSACLALLGTLPRTPHLSVGFVHGITYIVPSTLSHTLTHTFTHTYTHLYTHTLTNYLDTLSYVFGTILTPT